MKPKSMKITSATMTVIQISWPVWYASIYPTLTAKEAIATCPNGHLSKTLATALDDQDNIEKELEALQEIDTNAGPVAINAKSYVAVILNNKANISTHIAWGFPQLTAHRVPSRIEANEDFPELHARAVHCQ
jgi:hypothetical protein